jgi:cysteine sulfinate desulfinase/cysteine desulfurase-like protein
VTYLDVDAFGLIQPKDLEKAITDKTILITIMMANNEVGTILPIKELAAIAQRKNVLFHTDAVQAIAKIDVNVEDLGIDILSLSAHKFYGPKGVGALYTRKGVELEPVVHGGDQEFGLRAGTQNVPAIVGLGKAAELARKNVSRTEHMKKLRDELKQGIMRLIPDAKLNGHPESRLPNTLSMTLPGLRGESVVIAMDQHGIALSSGSACKSGSPEPTHVLIAMGKSEEDAHCSVRLSVSHSTTRKEVEETLYALSQVLEEMETTIRFLPCK